MRRGFLRLQRWETHLPPFPLWKARKYPWNLHLSHFPTLVGGVAAIKRETARSRGHLKVSMGRASERARA